MTTGWKYYWEITLLGIILWIVVFICAKTLTISANTQAIHKTTSDINVSVSEIKKYVLTKQDEENNEKSE